MFYSQKKFIDQRTLKSSKFKGKDLQFKEHLR